MFVLHGIYVSQRFLVSIVLSTRIIEYHYFNGLLVKSYMKPDVIYNFPVENPSIDDVIPPKTKFFHLLFGKHMSFDVLVLPF